MSSHAALSLPGKVVHPEFARTGEYEFELAQFGQGQWGAFRALGIDLAELFDVARGWWIHFDGITRPWLCWNVNSDWCFVQQKLVVEAGWTPVVGYDPRVGPPAKLVPEAVVVDFNERLRLPLLYPHFPLEFAFLFCRRIAFWHSDLFVRREKMRRLATMFEELEDGQTAAVWVRPGLRHMLTNHRKRYWELVGCTTRAASRDQFVNGCGWWMAYWAHPNQENGERIKRNYYWDHGAGIYYWHRRLGGECIIIDGQEFEEGHFTKIGNRNYVRTTEAGGSDARRNMSEELVRNFDLVQACSKLDISDLVGQTAI
ncbi:MAG: hypothetical protein KGJ78_02340 [Alphaproteobacteria bacterium]|nr:hypothetical protein [Alphaproteobacteria bacterium]